MSDVQIMQNRSSRAIVDVFVTDDVGGSSGNVDRAIKLLNGFPHGAEKAIGSAIKRAAISGEAYAARAVGQHYYIKAGDFKTHTKSKRRIHTSFGETTVEITYKGTHIPLLKFKTGIVADGRIKAQVKKNSSAQTFKHAFIKAPGKFPMGIYQRVGKKRIPLEQYYGPSAPQMMESNDDVAQAIGDKVRETFDKRIGHEILAVMNGWRA